jgi:hypothetical protein
MVKRLLAAAFVVLVAPATVLADEMRFNLFGDAGFAPFAEARIGRQSCTRLVAGNSASPAISGHSQYPIGSKDPSLLGDASVDPTCRSVVTGLILRGPAAHTAFLGLEHRERIRQRLADLPGFTHQELDAQRATRAHERRVKRCRMLPSTCVPSAPLPRVHH